MTGLIRKAFLVSLVCVVSVLTTTPLLGAEDTGVAWPRDVVSPVATITVYQPQIDTFSGDSLTARAAIAVRRAGGGKTTYGAVWLRARAGVHKDNRTVTLTNLQVPIVKLPGASQAQTDTIARILEAKAAQGQFVLSLDKLIASLDAANVSVTSGSGFNNAPPKIIVVNYPAVLIPVDGEPKLRKVEGYNLQEAENTPFFVVKDAATGYYYIKGGPIWYRGTLEGDDPKFAQVESAPPEVVAYYRSIASEEDLAADTSTIEREKAPRLLFTREPAELISYDGKPEFQPIKGTELLYLSNSEDDLFMDIPSQQYYVLFSGRWFRTASLDGPWAYVPSDNIPGDFKKIPPDSPKGHVLASVAGTQQAREAVLENQIPQTAEVSIDSAKTSVQYDGDPKFKPIENTEMKYAVNTATPVILCEGRYFACDNGVWFVAAAPTGPWAVCTTVPAAIYTIPPSCPAHNVTYVQVYGTTPTTVVYGYTPGYCGSYVYGPTVIYGTGYYYPGWYGAYYYPRPVTYGFNFHYNPWTGWSMGFTVGTAGPGGWFSISVGGGWWGPPVYRPPYMYRPVPYYRPPAYYRPPYAARPPAGGRPGYTPPRGSGARPSTLPSGNIYGNRQRPGVRPATPATPSTRPSTGRQPGVSTQPGRPSTQPTTRPNNMYADPQGNVYKRGDQGWQQMNPDRSGQADRNKPSTDQMDRSNRQQLDRDAQARQRGVDRSTDYQRSTRPSAPRSAPRGGGRRR